MLLSVCDDMHAHARTSGYDSIQPFLQAIQGLPFNASQVCLQMAGGLCREFTSVGVQQVTQWNDPH